MDEIKPFSADISVGNESLVDEAPVSSVNLDFEEAKDAYKFLTAKKKIPEDYKVPEHPKGYEAPAGYLPTLVAAGELGYTKKTLDSLMTKLEDDTISDAEWKILHKITLRGEHWEKTVEESLEWLKVKRESESNTIPQGEFYHKDKGWY